ncbi:nucleotidyltransferase domain-containing protein [Cupriavidus sp. RAF12]|uniref:nucleotidyltransferase domain-containing protein n=1 Tax=Cupriavidus sp. RAF12 TaxID=3233050 RepID=UPI003F8DCDB8
MNESFDMRDLVQTIGIRDYGEDTVGLLLTGSFAKGNATPHSDVDLIVSSADIQDGGQRIFRHCGRLVNLKIQSRETLASVLVDPQSACRYLTALTYSVPLIDRDGFLQDLLDKARNFDWTPELIYSAHRDAAAELIAWLEEVHKGIAGLELGDSGRLLQAVHGCSWGMLRVVQLHLRVLEGGDNTVVDDVMAAVGAAAEWPTLLRTAIGLTGASLSDRVEAGLELFCATSELVQSSFLPDEMRMIEPSLAQTREFLTSRPRHWANQPTAANAH